MTWETPAWGAHDWARGKKVASRQSTRLVFEQTAPAIDSFFFLRRGSRPVSQRTCSQQLTGNTHNCFGFSTLTFSPFHKARCMGQPSGPGSLMALAGPWLPVCESPFRALQFQHVSCPFSSLGKQRSSSFLIMAPGAAPRLPENPKNDLGLKAGAQETNVSFGAFRRPRRFGIFEIFAGGPLSEHGGALGRVPWRELQQGPWVL